MPEPDIDDQIKAEQLTNVKLDNDLKRLQIKEKEEELRLYKPYDTIVKISVIIFGAVSAFIFSFLNFIKDKQ